MFAKSLFDRCTENLVRGGETAFNRTNSKFNSLSRSNVIHAEIHKLSIFLKYVGMILLMVFFATSFTLYHGFWENEAVQDLCRYKSSFTLDFNYYYFLLRVSAISSTS